VVPTFEEILNGVKLEANMGACARLVRLGPKAHCLDILKDSLFRNFLDDDGEFRFQLSRLPILIFTRLQFKVTTIKTRLVFAYPGEIAILESALLKIIVSLIDSRNVNVSYSSGLTQLDVSNKVKSLYGELKGSLDASGFDLNYPAFYLILFFCVFENTIFKSSPVARRILKFLCWYAVNGVCYHKNFGIVNRFGGLMSGSGLTNMLGTFGTVLNGYLVDSYVKDFDISSLYGSGDDLCLSFINVICKDVLAKFCYYSSLFSNFSYEGDSRVTLPAVNTVDFLGST